MNPILHNIYTADPSVLEYKGTVYLYTGHDTPPDGVEDYVMHNWCCFSSCDLVTWKGYPPPLKAVDFAWAAGDAFASKVICRNDRFYWYAALTHQTIPGKAIGVAVADTPEGPFHDAKCSALIAGNMLPLPVTEKANLDPTVLVDNDGQAYIFWGNTQCYYARLKDNMIELDGEIHPIGLPGFNEGAHVYRRGDWYYLMYGYGFPEKVAYAMSRNINGPWEFKGIVNEVAGNCETNRPATLDFQGKSYFFYHNGALKDGGSHRRSVCVDYLYYNEDGTIQRVVMTTEGI